MNNELPSGSYVKPLKDGGRVVAGQGHYLTFGFILSPDADGHEGKMVRNDGTEVGEWRAVFVAPPKNSEKPNSTIEAIRNLWKGVVGNAQVATGRNKAPDSVAKERMAICMECEMMHSCLKDTRHCCGKISDFADTDSPTCGCILETKTKLATASCPLAEPKWTPVEEG